MSPSAPSAVLLAHFSALSDPRQRWRVLYPLPEILLLVLCATLSGMEDFVEIRLWGDERLDFLRRFLPYERGLPAHDTLNDVINGLDADLFKTCFANWVETLRDRAPDKIVQRGGDYLLALKGNRPALHRDVVAFFDDPPAEMLEPPHKTTDGEHGRIEERRHVVCHEVDWLFSDRRYKDEPRFPRLAMIGMVESRVERNGAVARERRYYLSSTPLDAKTFAAAVRAHWGVENRLHWVLDVVFHDDLARLRSGNGPQNMAVVKHMAMNLVRNPKDKHSLKVRRKLANLNPDYLETLIRQAPALT